MGGPSNPGKRDGSSSSSNTSEALGVEREELRSEMERMRVENTHTQIQTHDLHDSHMHIGDWTCPSCNANVFASKNECFRCQVRQCVCVCLHV